MGSLTFDSQSYPQLKNMKLFLIAAVLIASVFAEPESEAKADAWYGAYGYVGYPYAGTYGAWTGAYGLGYNGYASGYRYLGKRSADSDADAKPWLTYGAGYPYAATYGAYAAPVATYAHAAYAAPVATYAGAHLIGKRSADSDAEAKPSLAYSNYGYAGYPYASTYGAYAAPVATYAHAAYTTPYATYGAHLIGKRSAEAEPESWYGAYGYASPYTTYGGYSA